MTIARRAVLGGLATVGLAGLAAPAGAQADKTVYFLSWGGTVQTMLEKEGWADQFQKDTGYTVRLVPKATSAEIVATAIAQKDKPQVDVVMCDLAAFQQGIEQGIFTKLEAKEVPNLAKMAEGAPIGETGITTYADILSIIYHKEAFQRNGWAPPTKWADLFRPELKGKVIVPPVSNTYGMYYLVELARENGGGVKNIDPGFQALKKLAPSVVDWTTTFAKISDLLQQETALVAVFGNASGWEIVKRGVPADVLVPTPSYMSPTVAGIMKGAPNAEGARVFLNWLISEKVLKYRAERFGQSPMNREVKVEGENAKRVLTGDELKKLIALDYDEVASRRSEWNARFQREVAPIR
jgi:putative spermidine/putrescine transport system substrate-binding protein